MQPLILSIPGDFWDVQIYRGRLYLWHYDGRLSVYDWGRLIELAYPKASRSLAVKAAWLRGNSLYNPDVLDVFDDPAFRKVLDKQHEELRHDTPFITSEMLEKSLYGVQDNPVNELPTDTEIYNNVLYLVTYDGFWSARAHSNSLRYPVSSRPKKRWDAPVYSASASHRRIALSAGDEGLFDYDIDYVDGFEDSVDGGIARLTHRHSSYVDWAFASIYNTSLVGRSSLLAYCWQYESTSSSRGRRTFVREVDESEILRNGHGADLSWGAGDKICDVSGDELTVTRYVQQNVTSRGTRTHAARLDSDGTVLSDAEATTGHPLEPGELPFFLLGTITTSTRSDIVKAGLAYFGILLETNEQLVVYRNNSDPWTFPGPIVRWRTYPRAKFYENHLHIIAQDAVHIVAFMHDYWEDQEEKIAGIRYRYKAGPRRSTL